VLTLWQLILADDPAEMRGLRLWSERRRSKLSITSLSELLRAKPFIYRRKGQPDDRREALRAAYRAQNSTG